MAEQRKMPAKLICVECGYNLIPTLNLHRQGKMPAALVYIMCAQNPIPTLDLAKQRKMPAELIWGFPKIRGTSLGSL